MKLGIPLLALLLGLSLSGQTTPTSPAAEDISGMYSFVQDGEFVQLTVEGAGRVTGFISRYGDSDSDRGVFLNQFFKTGKIDGASLTFTTETVHATWYAFTGTIDHTPGKHAGDEAYRLLRGTLTESRTDVAKKITANTREVVFKSFPEEVDEPRK